MFFDGLIKSIDNIVVNLALSQVCLDGRKFCCYSVEALSELIYVGRWENRSCGKGFESQLCLQSLKFFSPHTRKGHFGLGHEGVRRRQLTVGCRRRKKRRGRGIFEGSPSLSFRSLAQAALDHARQETCAAQRRNMRWPRSVVHRIRRIIRWTTEVEASKRSGQKSRCCPAY